jgi:hypothetical protein
MNIEDQFDAYLNNEMSDIEKADFEKEIETNADLKSEFEAHKQAIKAINKVALEELRQEMNSWDDEGKNSRSNLKYYISAAAAVIIMAAFYFILKPSNSQELFDEYYSTYPNVVNVRDANSNKTADLLQLYSAKNYQAFINKCNSLGDANDTLLFYKGIAHIELKQNVKATEQFKLVENDGLFGILAKYYGALAYLRDNKKTEAILLLNEVSQNEQSSYATKAQEILDSL